MTNTTTATPQQTDKPERLSVITPICRCSYPHLWQPQPDKTDPTKKVYSFTAIWEPDQVDALIPLLQLARKTRDAKWPNIGTTKVQSPFRIYMDDMPEVFKKHLNSFYQFTRGGDVPGRAEETNGKITAAFRCYSTDDRPIIPGILGPDRQPMLNQGDLYAGCYVIASVSAFAYERDGNKGVSFGLSHVMKVRDGQPLSSFKSAEETFADIDLSQYGVDNSALLGDI